MRAIISCLLLGIIVPTNGQAASCGDATEMGACFALAASGMNCLWSSVWSGQFCVPKDTVQQAVYGWSWDGQPIAASDGMKRDGSADGATNFNDFDTHPWQDLSEYGDFQTYIRTGADGRPTAMGISIPADLDTTFPRDDPRHSNPGARFALPRKHHCSKVMPFNHVQLNYVANGHPGGYPLPNLFKAIQETPESVGDVFATSSYFQRQLEVHFHLDKPEESNEIICTYGEFPPCRPSPEEKLKFENAPAPEYAPASMMRDPFNNVPFMGAHWQNTLGVEFDEFLHQYAPNFGTYDGDVVFWMGAVTPTSLEELEAGGTKEWDWVVPEKVQKTGYYPRKFLMRKTVRQGLGLEDAREVYQIEFADMEFRLGDDAYKKNGGLRKNMSEDDLCPAIDCTDMESWKVDQTTKEFCTTCGTYGVRAHGKRTKGSKTAKLDTSCECMTYCKGTSGSAGFKFQQRRSKKGKCTCLTKVILKKKEFDGRFTSAVF